MRKIFNDTSIQKQFDKDGFVCLPFISLEKVEKLKKLFFETLPQSGGQIRAEEIDTADVTGITYDFTFIDKSQEYKQTVYDIITKEFAPEAEKLLAHYKPIIANYIRKKANSGEVPVHQNWAFVDETKSTSVSIWCPLVDSFRENGTLEVVPGSHKRFGKFRGPMVPWELENIKPQLIEKYLQPLDTKAGHAVILDDSIVHYSRPNKTNGLRLAIQLILIPEELPSVHYHLDNQKPNEIKIWEVDQGFYMKFNPWMKAEGVKTIGTIPFKQKSISVSEFEQGLLKPKFDEDGRFFARIKKYSPW